MYLLSFDQVLLGEDSIGTGDIDHILQRICVARTDQSPPHHTTLLPNYWRMCLATRGGSAIVGYQGTDIIQVLDGGGQLVSTRYLTLDGRDSLILHDVTVAPSGRVIVLEQDRRLMVAYD